MIAESCMQTAQRRIFFHNTPNALAILTGLATSNTAAMIGNQLIADSTLAPASIYFKYYLHLALVKAGKGDDYLSWLDKWRENMEMGLTTWAENSEINTSRSDCHAWGSGPNIEFFRILLGIDSDAPGFSFINITPHLGSIRQIGDQMPHPNGKIRVDYRVVNGRLYATIHLPPATSSRLNWKGATYPLKAGINQLTTTAK